MLKLFIHLLQTLIYGTFLFKETKINISRDVKIVARIPEEKGTDVNLAVHILNDAHKKEFEAAVIISNDSDLAEAVRIITGELKLKVGIINPHEKFNKKISQYATFKMPARESHILNSQFPAILTDSVGTFHKPPSW